MSHTQKIKQLSSAVSMAAALALTVSCGAAVAESAKANTITTKETAILATAPVAAARDARASKVIGRDVRDVQGKRIGDVHDLIVDLGSDRIQYVVLSFGGVMGVGDKLFAFPASSFRNPHSSGDLVLEVAKESLKKAPGFDRKKWPDFGDKTYRQEIDSYFGVANATAPAIGPNQQLARVSKLIGKDINDKAGKDAGEIEDVVVDLGASKVRYVVVDFDKAWSPDDKLIALPLKALTFPAKTDEDLVINVPRERLEMAKGFDEKSWPDINSATWREDLDRYMDKFPSAAGTPAK
jgi:sporulation protein YlmC with PRC-barrel domain